jgi:hypothetical protein
MMHGYLGAAVNGGAVAVVLMGFFGAMPIGWTARLTLAGIAGAWLGLVIASSASGVADSPVGMLVLFATPIVIVGVASSAFPAVRAALLGIPLSFIVGVNVIRLLGVQFLILAYVGQLSGPFPFSAGIGDIIVGASAIGLARLAARAPANDPRILAWNAFGVLDLVSAVALAMISRNGPLQLIHAGVGSAAITSLPLALIPLVLVPIFLILHGIVFIRARRSAPVVTPAYQS